MFPECGYTQNVLAYYQFEDIPADPLADTVGSFSGMMHDGATATSVPGPPGCGTAFGVTDPIAAVIPDDDAFDLSVGSIDFWVQTPTGVLDPRAVLSRDHNLADTEHLTILVSTVFDGQISQNHLVVRHQAMDTAAARCSENPLPVGEWVHVGYNFGPPDIELYINGELQSSSATATVPGGTIDCDGAFAAGIVADTAWWVAASILEESSTSTSPSFYLEGGALDELRISTVRRDFGMPP